MAERDGAGHRTRHWRRTGRAVRHGARASLVSASAALLPRRRWRGASAIPKTISATSPDVTINHTVDPGGSFVVIHSGPTPQTAETGPNTLVGSASASSEGRSQRHIGSAVGGRQRRLLFRSGGAYLSYTFQLSSTPRRPGRPACSYSCHGICGKPEGHNLCPREGDGRNRPGIASRVCRAENYFRARSRSVESRSDKSMYKPDTDITSNVVC